MKPLLALLLLSAGTLAAQPATTTNDPKLKDLYEIIEAQRVENLRLAQENEQLKALLVKIFEGKAAVSSSRSSKDKAHAQQLESELFQKEVEAKRRAVGLQD